jgi:hypothetical protein
MSISKWIKVQGFSMKFPLKVMLLLSHFKVRWLVGSLGLSEIILLVIGFKIIYNSLSGSSM